MIGESLRKVGIDVGHHTDNKNSTGVTVFVAKSGARIGMDIRGSSTGSYNTEAYGSHTSARDTVHAVVLAGGASFGMESFFGVMQRLEEERIGTSLKQTTVPGITGAVINDLNLGDPTVRPTKADGYHAASNALRYPEQSDRQGNVGAGTGATTGKWQEGRDLKGGFGSAEVALPNGIVVCSFAVVNPVGDVVNPDGEFYYDAGGYRLPNVDTNTSSTSPENTTLAVVATNVAMERDQLTKVAQLAQVGMVRSIDPINTGPDGDIIFALSSKSGEQIVFPGESKSNITDQVGAAASHAVALAIKNGIRHATSAGKYPSYTSLYPGK